MTSDVDNEKGASAAPVQAAAYGTLRCGDGDVARMQ
jgi:hypothetical protein